MKAKDPFVVRYREERVNCKKKQNRMMKIDFIKHPANRFG